MANSKIWGDFEVFLDQVLGQGGMGAVYKGRQISVDRPVAIKVLKKDLTGASDFIQRFQREAKLVARIVDSHVVQVFGAGEAEELHYYVMEFVEGKDLSHKIRSGTMATAKEILDVAESVGLALQAAWKYKIVHRDIKPSNIILTSDSQIKVMDFGLAKNPEMELTRSNLIMGTVKYISPEQATGGDVDVRADIYSLGCVLYEMAVGVAPFKGDSPTAVIYQHVHKRPNPPRTVNPDLPESVQALILRCIAKRPEDRYQTPEALIAEARTLMEGGKPEALTLVLAKDALSMPDGPTAILPDSRIQAPPNRTTLIAAIAAAAVVLLVVGFFIIRGMGGKPDPGPVGPVDVPTEVLFETKRIDIETIEEDRWTQVPFTFAVKGTRECAISFRRDELSGRDGKIGEKMTKVEPSWEGKVKPGSSVSFTYGVNLGRDLPRGVYKGFLGLTVDDGQRSVEHSIAIAVNYAPREGPVIPPDKPDAKFNIARIETTTNAEDEWAEAKLSLVLTAKNDVGVTFIVKDLVGKDAKIDATRHITVEPKDGWDGRILKPGVPAWFVYRVYLAKETPRGTYEGKLAAQIDGGLLVDLPVTLAFKEGAAKPPDKPEWLKKYEAARESADRQFSESKWPQAYEAYRAAVDQLPDDDVRKAECGEKMITCRFLEAKEKGERLAKEKRLEDAILAYDEARKYLPDGDSRIMELERETRSFRFQIKRTSGAERMARQNWLPAAKDFEDAREFGSDAEAREMAELAKFCRLFQEANEAFLVKEDFAKAKPLYEELLSNPHGLEEEIRKKLNAVRDEIRKAEDRAKAEKEQKFKESWEAGKTAFAKGQWAKAKAAMEAAAAMGMEVSGDFEKLLRHAKAAANPPEGFVYVPAGKFTFGEGGTDKVNGPQQEQETVAYYIGKREVSNGEYAKFLAAKADHSKCHEDEPEAQKKKPHVPDGWSDSLDPAKPAVGMDWFDAWAYAGWAGMRLPSEVEWEKAAGTNPATGGRTVYPWGDDFNKGKDGPSACGAENMGSSVLEWCDDWYRAYPGGKSGDIDFGRKRRVTRGGVFLADDAKDDAKVTRRFRSLPDRQDRKTGFRVVKTVE